MAKVNKWTTQGGKSRIKFGLCFLFVSFSLTIFSSTRWLSANKYDKTKQKIEVELIDNGDNVEIDAGEQSLQDFLLNKKLKSLEIKIETSRNYSLDENTSSTEKENAIVQEIVFNDDQLITIIDLPYGKKTVKAACLNPSAEINSEGAYQEQAWEAIEEYKLLGSPVPVIVGGVGDSGTRGVYELLSQLRIYMGKGKEAIKLDTKDSRLFSFPINITLLDGSEKSFTMSSFINPGIKSNHSIFYCRESLLDEQRWYLGIQFIAKMLKRQYQYYFKHASLKWRKGRKLVYYGFKHPRSVLLLPLFKAVLGKEFRYIHVIRDAREIVSGNNKRFYNDICPLFYTNTSLCRKTKRNQLRFWAEFNSEVIAWMKEVGSPEQFLLGKFSKRDSFRNFLGVRAEDLVGGDPACLERVARFVGADEKAIAKLPAISAKYTKFAISYSGNKLGEEERVQLTEFMNQVPAAKIVLERLGYQLNSSMGVANNCENLSLDIL